MLTQRAERAPRAQVGPERRPRMRCPSCGARVRRDHDRCPSCGAALAPGLEAQFGGAARDVRPQLGMPDGPSAQPAPAPARPRRRRLPWVVAGVVALVGVACVCVLVARGLGGRGAGVAIDSATFPDAALRAVVRTYDADGDGALSAGEVAGITALDCSDRDVTSLAGVERLGALETLDASGNRIASADLSGCASLVSADVSGNGMSALTLGSLPNLESLDVSGNVLSGLDLSGCTALRSLDCRGNGIARLDLSRNAEVDSLAISDGQNVTVPIAAGFFPDEGLRASLQALDADGDGALSERERTSVTSLSGLDGSTQGLAGLAWFPNLASLDVSGTQVSRLSSDDLPGQVTSVGARGCPLADVSLSGLAWLYTLDVADTPLASLDLSGLTRITTLDVSGCPSLASLDVSGCQATLATLWCDEGLAVTGGVAKTSAAFPDAALRAAVFASPANANGDCLLTPAELASLTTLDLTGAGMTSAQGLALLSSLSSLTCSGANLHSFSCAGLGALTSLSLTSCGLTSVSLEGAPHLASLDVSNNSLTALDLSATPELASLVVTGNAGLAQVDVSACPALADGDGVVADEGTQVVAGPDEGDDGAPQGEDAPQEGGESA